MRRGERGNVAEFTLVLLLFVPLVLGLIQFGLVLHVRNTLTAAATDGARAGAPLHAGAKVAVQRTRTHVEAALNPRYAQNVRAHTEQTAGGEIMVVSVRAAVPALGLFGPGVPLNVHGRALMEQEP